jgi:putative salt-induced outer membrane protein YdiY
MSRVFVALLLCGLHVSAALAQGAAPPPPPPKLEVSAEGAFVGNTGNTNTTTTGLGGALINRTGDWVFDQAARFNRNRAGEVVSAQSITYRFAAKRALTKRLSAVGEYRYLRDQFAGIDHQHMPFASLSLSLVDNPTASFAVRGGVGLLDERRTSAPDVRSAAYGPGFKYRWKLPRGSEFNGDFLMFGRFDVATDWRIAHTVDFTTDLTKILALKVGHAVRYSHQPIGGTAAMPRAATDTTSTVSIVVKVSRN